MPFNDYLPYDDAELLSQGYERTSDFTSGHVVGGVYKPHDYDPELLEQYAYRIGVVPAQFDSANCPVDHDDHVESVRLQIRAHLVRIGDRNASPFSTQILKPEGEPTDVLRVGNYYAEIHSVELSDDVRRVVTIYSANSRLAIAQCYLGSHTQDVVDLLLKAQERPY